MKNSADRESRAAATVKKMTGIALLWFALATLVYVPTSSGDAGTALVALTGFLSFAAGLSLFSDALKKEILASRKE